MGDWWRSVDGDRTEDMKILKKENKQATVDGWNPASVEVGSLSHYLQGFIHPRWWAGFLPSTVPCLFCTGFSIQYILIIRCVDPNSPNPLRQDARWALDPWGQNSGSKPPQKIQEMHGILVFHDANMSGDLTYPTSWWNPAKLFGSFWGEVVEKEFNAQD